MQKFRVGCLLGLWLLFATPAWASGASGYGMIIVIVAGIAVGSLLLLGLSIWHIILLNKVYKGEATEKQRSRCRLISIFLVVVAIGLSPIAYFGGSTDSLKVFYAVVPSLVLGGLGLFFLGKSKAPAAPQS